MRLFFQRLLLVCCLTWTAQTGHAQEAVPATEDAGVIAPATSITTEPPAVVVPPPAPQLPDRRTSHLRGLTPAPSVNNPPGGGKGTVGVIDFQGTPLQAVLEYYASNLAKRSIISAQLPPMLIYFRSQSDLTVEEAKAALESVFAINGISVIPMGDKFLKVVQIATAKQEGLPFIGEGKIQPTADALMTQVIPLRYAETSDIVAALQPYMHSYGQLLALPKSSCLLISETSANVNQMLEIVKYLDVPSALKMETRVFLLTHAKAADVVQRLQGIIQETQQAGARASAPTPMPTPTPMPGSVPGGIRPTVPGGAKSSTTGSADDSLIEGKVIITADERTNKIFILSRSSNFAFFEKLIAELDAKVEPEVITKVILLQYDTAENAASLLNALITGGAPSSTGRRTSSTSSTAGRTGTPSTPPPPIPISSGGGGASAQDAGLLQFAQGVRILPDPRTNTLLVMATKEDLARIELLVKSIDVPVAQVQIEVVIAEVGLNNDLDVGVNVFKRLFEAGQVSQAGASRPDQLTDTAQLPRLSDIASGVASNIGGSAGAFGAGGLTYFLSFQNLGLDAVVRALARSSKGKVLSTPVIQTMDNQEASILVGESVPVPVSQNSAVVGSSGTLATGNLTSNIEYKDAAIELVVTPRINPDGYVRMDINQKVNDFGPAVQVNGTSIPSITKREAKSSVAVQNGSTILLGGLIKENKIVSEKKVPFFGDVPFFGTVFKSKFTTKTRTELIMFIRPTVMRTDAEAVAEAVRRAHMLKAAEDLQLDKQFKRFEKDPSKPFLNDSANPPADIPPGAESQAVPANQESDRYTAKMKALQEPSAPPAAPQGN